MTTKGEFYSGLTLWVLGVSGCLVTSLFVTKHLLIVMVFFSSFATIGFVLTWCAALDWFADEFDDEIKESYKQEK